jgi:hypothetical protein
MHQILHIHIEIQLNQSNLGSLGVKPVIQPIRAKNIYKSSPFQRKKFLSLCCILTNTEWNGIINFIIEVKCISIILSPDLIDLVVFQYGYGGFDA